MRKIILSIVLVLTLNTKYQIPHTVYAQAPACDLCGYCEGGVKPSDYDACVACLYDSAGTPPTGEKEAVSWTVLGCIPTDPANFTNRILQVVISVIGVIMFVVFLYGGFTLLTSAGDPYQIASGKKLVTSSIVALLIIIFSVVILRFVGVEILKLPGFE